MIPRWGPLALAVLCGCGSLPRAGGERIVEAEGWAAEVAGDPAGTRQRALAQAQKAAVEKAVGVRLQASTRVEASIATRQRIWADVGGRVERYEILGERVEDGFHKTRIRAAIRRLEPGELEAAGPPPVAANVAVEGGALLGPAFAKNGFFLSKVDQAEFLVRGRASSREVLDVRLGRFSSSRSQVSVEVVEKASGNVVWRSSLESSALGVDFESASSQALEQAYALADAAAAAGLSNYLWKR